MTPIDPELVRAHLSKDPILAPLVEALPFPAIEPEKDLYIALLDSIVSQQLSGKAAATIFGRFLDLFPDGYPHPHQLLALPDDVLRSKGLSYAKASYLKSVAEFHLQHELDRDKVLTFSDDELVEHLVQIKGVGRWTVEMILMFSLNRSDVFAPDDHGITTAMRNLYGLEEEGRVLKKRMTAIAETWRPYRTYACRYLWRWKDAKN